ncbi:hypothetical protein NPIL_67651 [Nephila pilipes]|uniref:Uncharacterized protein n=1 Tax=Nephila pilipes TaxID=299642 RepID=A0A8X6UKT1_NEPPI|nr:hypothetical protein NPIL_67651 [Nephila pilipes]
MGKTSRLGGYENLPTNELDHYENVMLDSTTPPPVWMVQDPLPPTEMEWGGHNPPQAMMIPQQVPVEKRNLASMSGLPEDNHVCFQHELSDTLRRKTGDRKMISERERGDGSSEYRAVAGEIDKWTNASSPQPSMYDQGAVCYRPAVPQAENVTAASRMSGDGESTATEV